MTTEQLLLNKWQKLDHNQQEQVLAFMDSLSEAKETPKTSSLGQKLRAIRQEIIDSGITLLTAEEVEKEKAQRRGGYQGDN